MNDWDEYLSLYGVGKHERAASAWARGMTAVVLEECLPKQSKRERAIAYLRSVGKYCLDGNVARIPPKECPQTILTKWLKERHK